MAAWDRRKTVWGAISIFMSCVLLAGCGPGGDSPPGPAVSSSPDGRTVNDLEACLVGHWMHSHEEDTAEVAIYRREGYPFPPARGRTGFEFLADGRAVYFGIAATDGTSQVPGHWEVQEPDTVRVTMDDQRVPPIVSRVHSCGPDLLTLSR